MDADVLAALRGGPPARRREPASLELAVQLTSAEFCASLSQVMLSSRNTSPATAAAINSSAEHLLDPVRLDLSAHYGSMAVRRGRGRRLGPCSRRGTSATRGDDLHLWQCRKLTRLWCPRCGVRLLPGISTCRAPEFLTDNDRLPTPQRQACVRCLRMATRRLRRMRKATCTSCQSAKDGKEDMANAIQQSLLKQRRRKRRRAGRRADARRQPRTASVTPAQSISVTVAPQQRPRTTRAPSTAAKMNDATSRRVAQSIVPSACIPPRTARNRRQQSDNKCPPATARQERDFTTFQCYLADYDVEETVNEIVRRIVDDHAAVSSTALTHAGHHRRGTTQRTSRSSYAEGGVAADCAAAELGCRHKPRKVSLTTDMQASQRASARGGTGDSLPSSTGVDTGGAVAATTLVTAAAATSDENTAVSPEKLSRRVHYTRHKRRHGGEGKSGLAHRKHASARVSVAVSGTTATAVTDTMTSIAVSDTPRAAHSLDPHCRRTGANNEKSRQRFLLGTELEAYEWPWCWPVQTQSTAAVAVAAGQEGTLGGAAAEVMTLAQRQQRLLLSEEVAEQFHLFRFLAGEYLLATPYAFLASHALPISMDDRRRMVELYYTSEPTIFCRYFGQRLLSYKRSGEVRASWRIGFARWLPWRWRRHRSASATTATAITAAQKVGDESTKDGLREGARRRQWVNLHHVCTTITAMYRGEGGVYVAADVPVLTAVQQCFALRGTLARYYATAVFGHEHDLAGRLFDHLHSYDEYVSVCDVLGELWCDESRLLLRESFVDGCRRVSRLLEDSRVLAEVHQALFDEVMRPRWQVQLDEVQRVIIPTASTVDKAHLIPAAITPTLPPSTSLPCLTAQSLPGGVSSTGVGVASSATLPIQERRNDNTSLAIASQLPLPGPVVVMATTASPTTRGHGSNVTSKTTIDVASSPVNGCFVTQATANVATQHRSANQLFTRRFLLLFGSVMKQLARVAAHLGVSESINDALEVYCGRVFGVLGMVGSRTQAASATNQLGRSQAAAPLTAAPATSSHTIIGGDGATSTTTARTTAAPTPERAAAIAQEATLSTPTATRTEHTVTSPQSHGPTNASEDGKGLVNTSMVYMPSANPPPMANCTAADLRVRRSLSAPQLPAQPMPVDTERTTGIAKEKLAAAPLKPQGSGRESSPLMAHQAAQPEPTVLDRTGHHELRELCLMLSMLPGVWRHLASVTADEHEDLDTVVTSLMDALRTVTQILLASEDFAHP